MTVYAATVGALNKHLGTVLANAKDSDKIGLDDHGRVKIGQSSVLGKIRYARLDDKNFKTHSSGSDEASDRSAANNKAKSKLVSDLAAGAARLTRENISQHFADARNDYHTAVTADGSSGAKAAAVNVPAFLSDSVALRTSHSADQAVSFAVRRLVEANLDVTKITESHRATAGDIRRLMPEIDKLIGNAVEAAKRSLDADLQHEIKVTLAFQELARHPDLDAAAAALKGLNPKPTLPPLAAPVAPPVAPPVVAPVAAPVAGPAVAPAPRTDLDRAADALKNFQSNPALEATLKADSARADLNEAADALKNFQSNPALEAALKADSDIADALNALKKFQL